MKEERKWEILLTKRTVWGSIGVSGEEDARDGGDDLRDERGTVKDKVDEAFPELFALRMGEDDTEPVEDALHRLFLLRELLEDLCEPGREKVRTLCEEVGDLCALLGLVSLVEHRLEAGDGLGAHSRRNGDGEADELVEEVGDETLVLLRERGIDFLGGDELLLDLFHVLDAIADDVFDGCPEGDLEVGVDDGLQEVGADREGEETEVVVITEDLVTKALDGL